MRRRRGYKLDTTTTTQHTPVHEPVSVKQIVSSFNIFIPFVCWLPHCPLQPVAVTVEHLYCAQGGWCGHRAAARCWELSHTHHRYQPVPHRYPTVGVGNTSGRVSTTTLCLIDRHFRFGIMLFIFYRILDG